MLFATFAEAVAEGRGKAQAATLRRMRSETMAKLLLGVDDMFEPVRADTLKVGDMVLVEAGDLVPADGEVDRGRGHRSTNRPSPANRRPSSARPAATARP